VPDSIFNCDRDFIQIILIKDKIQQIYKSQIKESLVINNVNDRLNKKDFIEPSSLSETESLETQGMADSMIEFNQWMTRFSHTLNKLFQINLNDLSKMIYIGSIIFFGIHINRFFHSNTNELRFICSKNVLFKITFFIKLYGHNFAHLVLEFHSRLKRLNLTENELALLNVFMLFSCNCKFNI